MLSMYFSKATVARLWAFSSRRMVPLAPLSGMSLFLRSWVLARLKFSSKRLRQLMLKTSLLTERTMRMPPRAMSAKRRWKPRNSEPITKNMPKSLFGYSAVGRNDGFMRNESATLVDWKKLVLSTCWLNMIRHRKTSYSWSLSTVERIFFRMSASVITPSDLRRCTDSDGLADFPRFFFQSDISKHRCRASGRG